MIRILFLFLILTSFLRCSTLKIEQNTTNLEYQEWKKKRIENLKSPKGYLSLAGLYWLKPGTYNIGSEKSNEVLFPDAAPPHIGAVTILKDKYHFEAATPVFVNGEKKESVELYTDLSSNVTEINHGSFYWHLIERGDKIGIRLKDTLNETRLNLKDVESYVYDPNFVFTAKVQLAKENETIPITNVIGVTQDQKVGGTLTFEIDEKEYNLKGLGNGYGSWFFVFGDETNSHTTYGGGRFLYVDIEEGATTTLLDFNYAYNPPCSFTAFATCPLPPFENKLPLRIEAGEKSDH